MVKKARMIVIHLRGQLLDNTIKKSEVRRLKYSSYLFGKVVAKGDSLFLGSGFFTTIWDTKPSGEVMIVEETKIKLEEQPYDKKFEDYDKWMASLRKKYGME